MKVQTKQNPYKNLIAFIPIVLMLAIVPLIVRAKIVLLDENTAKFWNGNYQVDLFSYTKTRMIMFLSVWMLVNAFFFFTKKDFKKLTDNKWIIYPVIVFVFSLIVSTVLSDHKNIAIWGAPERYEGMVVHLCYIIMFLYTYIALKTEDDFKYIKYSILFLATVMSFIGLMQSFGKDILTMDFMRNFIVPSEYKDMFSAVTTEGQQVYLTLQNSNYVGTYAAMIIPFLFMLCISKYEHKYIRIASGILTFLTFFILVKSGSKAGLFAVICIFILIPIIFYKSILNLKKTTIFITVAVILFTTIGVNIATGNKIAENLGKIVYDAKAVLMKDKDYVFDPTYGLPIYDIKLEKNRASVYTRGGILNIDFKENGELEFRDQDKLLKEFVKEDDNYYFTNDDNDNIGKYCFLKQNEKNSISIIGRTLRWGEFVDIEYYRIRVDESNRIYLINNKNEEYTTMVAGAIGFKGNERLFSNRGYIWSRTFFLILNKLIFGYGSDTFLTNFPQNDIPAKVYAYLSINMITDKPHNIYLLYAINNGLVGLFSILTLWFGYLVISIKNSIFKSRYNSLDLYKVPCILAIVGYMLTGILNDSVPVTAPILWVILGAGFAINKMVGKTYD